MQERIVQIHFRVTEKERIRFQANARKCGISLSEYLRKLASGYEPKALPPLEYQKIYDLLLDVHADWRSGGDPRLAKDLLDIIWEMMMAIKPGLKGRDENGDNKNLAGAG